MSDELVRRLRAVQWSVTGEPCADGNVDETCAAEAAERIEALEAERDGWKAAAKRAARNHLSAETALAASEAKVKALVETGNWLSVCAQTTGGTAGRDDALVEAIERWSIARRAARARRQ